MTIRSNRPLLLPLLVLGVAFAMTAPLLAHDVHAQGTSASLQVTFGSTPHWTNVRGTHVREIRAGEGPGYDMFNYGGSYYAYNNSHWYKSRSSRGAYTQIDDRAVPKEINKVPRNHWKSYPSSWGDENHRPNSDNQRQGHNR